MRDAHELAVIDSAAAPLAFTRWERRGPPKIFLNRRRIGEFAHRIGRSEREVLAWCYAHELFHVKNPDIQDETRAHAFVKRLFKLSFDPGDLE